MTTIISTKPTPKATLQLIFDRVATHLLTQNEKAVVGSHISAVNCRYRTNSGLSCAVGCLIDDHLYSPLIEGCVVPTLLSREDNPTVGDSALAAAIAGSLKVELTENLITFLGQLQTIHDFHDVENWKSELIRLADFWRLSTQAITDHEEKAKHKAQQAITGL